MSNKSQRLICELTSQVKQLTDAVQSLEEALTLKNGKLKKQENISRSLSKPLSAMSLKSKYLISRNPLLRQPVPSVRFPKERGITTQT